MRASADKLQPKPPTVAISISGEPSDLATDDMQVLVSRAVDAVRALLDPGAPVPQFEFTFDKVIHVTIKS